MSPTVRSNPFDFSYERVRVRSHEFVYTRTKRKLHPVTRKKARNFDLVTWPVNRTSWPGVAYSPGIGRPIRVGDADLAHPPFRAAAR